MKCGRLGFAVKEEGRELKLARVIEVAKSPHLMFKVNHTTQLKRMRPRIRSADGRSVGQGKMEAAERGGQARGTEIRKARYIGTESRRQKA